MLDIHGNQESGAGSLSQQAESHHNGATSISSILSASEACNLLGISQEQLQQKIDEGNICATKGSVTGMWLIDGACVKSMLRQSESKKHNEQEIPAEPQVHRLEASELSDVLFADDSPIDCSVTATEAVEYLDMAPPHDHSNFGSLLPPISPVIKPIAINARPAEGYFNRQIVSARTLQELLEGLEFTHERLQGAMYRIGFLENQVENLEERVKTLNEFRARAARSLIVEKENRELKAALNKLDEKLTDKDELVERKEDEIEAKAQELESKTEELEAKNQTIAEKDERLQEMEKALNAANERVAKIESQWLSKFMKALGFQIG